MRPILFQIGNFPVRSFGVMILIAFLAGVWLVRVRAKRYDMDVAKVTDLAFAVLVAGVLGARAGYLIQNIAYYKDHLNELFSLRFEGLTSFGGVLFGAVVALYWAWKNKASVGKLLDLYSLAFMLGHVFGRIGCFLNGCCYGGVCPVNTFLGTKFGNSAELHYPAQLYDSGMNLIGLLILLGIERTGKLKSGQLTGLFLILHGAIRYIYEFWRAGTDEENAAGQASSHYLFHNLPITEAQAVALVMCLIGLIVVVVAAFKPRPAPAPEIAAA